MKRIVVIGAGGHGRDVAAIAEACKINVEFRDDDPQKWQYRPAGGWFQKPYLVGVNDSTARKTIAYRQYADRPAGPLVHPTAYIGPDCSLGAGCVIGPYAVLTTGVVLGEHVHVNVGASISQGSTVGDFCTIGPGARVCGDVRLGPGVQVGASATVVNLIAVGKWSTIGAGAVVIRDVPEAVTVVGVPARVLT